jgi:short subunit dehydrogenase-like uncharacterized protein
MIDLYDELAKESGAKIVHFCGHDCIPWDLLVSETAKLLKKQKGENLIEFDCIDEIYSVPSGGTLDTALSVLSNRVLYKSRLGYDPLLKPLQSITSGGGSMSNNNDSNNINNSSPSSNKLITRFPSFLKYHSLKQQWCGPFVMASVMANCVKRSNALNHYSSKLIYSEAEGYPSFFAGFSQLMGFLAFGTALACPPLAYLLKKFFLPAPGQGPSEKVMDAGFLKVSVFAKGSNGSKVKGFMYFPTDPGYRDTVCLYLF